MKVTPIARVGGRPRKSIGETIRDKFEVSVWARDMICDRTL